MNNKEPKINADVKLKLLKKAVYNCSENVKDEVENELSKL